MAHSIMFIAGDVSGDEHASHVVSQILQKNKNTRVFGIGGPHMAAAGFEQLMPFGPFNRMGLAEVLSHLPFFLGAKAKLIKVLTDVKPDVLVCVDYPGFNIPIMKEAHKLGIPVVWYIVPQVWAWKKKRAAILGAYASYIGVVFPFEVPYFNQFAAPVEFVGHPLAEALDKRNVAFTAKSKQQSLEGVSQIQCAIVPGSRVQEIKQILGPMMLACMLLKRKYPMFQVIVSKCKGLPKALFETACNDFVKAFPQSIAITEEPLIDVLRKSDVAMVTSGTATLQTALCGVPMVICYKTSALTYTLLKRMITLPYIGLPNIVASEKIVPELIQHKANASEIAHVISQYIGTPSSYARTVQKLGTLREKLGNKCPSEEISLAIERLCDKRR